jgi:hypothetical protein
MLVRKMKRTDAGKGKLNVFCWIIVGAYDIGEV